MHTCTLTPELGGLNDGHGPGMYGALDSTQSALNTKAVRNETHVASLRHQKVAGRDTRAAAAQICRRSDEVSESLISHRRAVDCLQVTQ